MPIAIPAPHQQYQHQYSNTMSSHSVSQNDLDILSLLTSDVPLGPQQHRAYPRSQEQGAAWKKPMPRRDSPIDALLISAVLAGSGPVSRHHFGHGPARPGAYADCDNSRPSSPSAPPVPSKVVLRSMQAPRSERLKLQGERADGSGVGAEAIGIPGSSTGQGTLASPISSPISITSAKAGSDDITSPRSRPQSLSSSLGSKMEYKPKRRMSIDPTPVSQLLQAVAPNSNYYARSTPSATTSMQQLPSDARVEVRCMARTRVPTPHGEIFLHLYHNNVDTKEHLAIVYDPIQLNPEVRAQAPKGRKEIRSRSLNAVWREGETDMERVVRGAYVGRLAPGKEDQASAPSTSTASFNTIHEEAGSDILDGLYMDAEEEEEDILPMVRIHSECFTGETIGSMRCDCGEQLDEAMHLIAQPQPLPSTIASIFKAPLHGHSEFGFGSPSPSPGASRAPSPSATAFSETPQVKVPGRGVVIYLRQEGRGIGLLEKIRAYNLQDLGHDTVTANLMLGHGADERKYNVAAEILRDLGLGATATTTTTATATATASGSLEPGSGIKLLTNNPEKVEGLTKEGIKVSDRVPMIPRDWKVSHGLGHSHGHGHEAEEREYEDWRDRRAGVGLIGLGAARGPELEKYLRTKVERMGHMIPLPPS